MFRRFKLVIDKLGMDWLEGVNSRVKICGSRVLFGSCCWYEEKDKCYALFTVTHVVFAEHLEALLMLVVFLLYDLIGTDGIVDDRSILGGFVTQWRCERRRRRSRPALLKLRLQLLVRVAFFVQSPVTLQT